MSEKSALAKSRVRCREIMTSKVSTANGEMTIRAVAQMLKDGDIGALPVVEKDTNKLVGKIQFRPLQIRQNPLPQQIFSLAFRRMKRIFVRLRQNCKDNFPELIGNLIL